MRRQLLALSTRPLVSLTTKPWVCRRCMAQGAVAPVVKDDFLATSSAPQQSAEIQPLGVLSKSSQSSLYDAKQRVITEILRALIARFPVAHPLNHWQDILETDLPHDIPDQYLMYVNEEILTEQEKAQRRHMFEWAMPGHVDGDGKPKENRREIKGVVVSTGKMMHTVKVRLPGQRWEPKIGRYYASHTDHLVHDPNDSLIEGDVVILHRLTVSKQVKHVVGSVVVAYGTPLEQRPPIPTPEERLALYKQQRFAKAHRQHLRTKADIGDKQAADALLALKPPAVTNGKDMVETEMSAYSSKVAQMAADYIARKKRQAQWKAQSSTEQRDNSASTSN